uniref:Fes1 domain-containing protein n=1 Tax=Haemonchus contortus TaxID=6289 RepID=A0A7I4Y4N8_HAECO
MANEDVPQQYWNSLLALTTKATAGSEKRDVTPRPMSDENRKWLEAVMKDLVKEADPGRQMDAILQSLHSYASSPADLNETDLGKIEELTDHLEDILGYAEITNRFVGKGGLLVIETFLAQRHHLFLQCRFAELVLSLTENNPSTQSLFTREGLLVKMLKLLEDDSYSEEFLFKLLSSISGSVRSHLESFEVFCENDGPRILSNIVRKARNGKLAGKAARVMTSIAYTLEDSPSHAKRLTVDIMSNFLYVLRNFPSDCAAELEYIGDYVLASVDPKDIPSEILVDVVTCLKGRQVRISTAEDLVKKLSPT